MENKDMVVDEEPTLRVFGKCVDAHTEQLEDSLVRYLEKLMEGPSISVALLSSTWALPSLFLERWPRKIPW
jgi:hypothetical protein